MRSRLTLMLLAIGALAMLAPGVTSAKKKKPKPVAYTYVKSCGKSCTTTLVTDGKHKKALYIVGNLPPKACNGPSYVTNKREGSGKISKSGKFSWTEYVRSEGPGGEVVYGKMKINGKFKKKKGKRKSVRVTWKTDKYSSACTKMKKGAMTLKYKGPAYGG